MSVIGEQLREDEACTVTLMREDVRRKGVGEGEEEVAWRGHRVRAAGRGSDGRMDEEW